MYIGTTSLTIGLADPTALRANIRHEIGGHVRYGNFLSCMVLTHALIDSDTVDEHALFAELGHPEPELYSELKELRGERGSSIGDEPIADITRQIERLRTAFPADMAETILDSMDVRFDADPSLTAEAVATFRSLRG
jgi:hypothetical protein